MIGSVALKPKRALLLSTRILVGPGVIEATKANSMKGSSVDSMVDDSDRPIDGVDLHKPAYHLSGRFEQRLR